MTWLHRQGIYNMQSMLHSNSSPLPCTVYGENLYISIHYHMIYVQVLGDPENHKRGGGSGGKFISSQMSVGVQQWYQTVEYVGRYGTHTQNTLAKKKDTCTYMYSTFSGCHLNKAWTIQHNAICNIYAHSDQPGIQTIYMHTYHYKQHRELIYTTIQTGSSKQAYVQVVNVPSIYVPQCPKGIVESLSQNRGTAILFHFNVELLILELTCEPTMEIRVEYSPSQSNQACTAQDKGQARWF